MDFNVGSLVSLLTRMILQKCDKTEINLQDSKQQMQKATKAFKQMNGTVISKKQTHQPIISYLNELEPAILEDYLASILTFLTDLTQNQASLYLTMEIRASLEVVMTSVMSVSGLKIRGSAFSKRVGDLIAEVSANLVVSKTVKD